MEAPEWATHRLDFESGCIVFYNEKRWWYGDLGTIDKGTWDTATRKDYLLRMEDIFKIHPVEINFKLENE
ncbi:hypothetical protein [Citrobacter phage CVT22]|uniref:Uncharacterized protein n=1 Tax=Citrobacter phage CVT22 TaxID=1622234 RepID=A0A0R6C6U5_9CAUD|nr:hypothetical protein APL39_gp42 [Citrobacter phage CVT22]AJT60746.1 hypothetical protein [Citrobacter phage CVT22]